MYVKDLATAMSKLGHSIFILFLDRSKDINRDSDFEKEFLEDLNRHGVPYGFLGTQCRWNFLLGMARLRSHVREWRPDVVHAHLTYGVAFTAWVDVPVIYTHHNIKLRAKPWVYRWIFDRWIHAYVGICGACCDVLHDVTNRPVIRINNAVRAERVRDGVGACRERNPRTRVVAVGRLSRQKNYPLLLNAVSMLDDIDFELTIAGEGPQRLLLQDLAKQLGIDNKVQFLGNVSDVPTLLSESDIYVMSSAWEGLPIALIEATFAGLPVVVTDVGGCREVVDTVGNGIVVESGNERQLADAMRRLLWSGELRRSLSINALKNSAPYSLETAVDRHLDLYQLVKNR